MADLLSLVVSPIVDRIIDSAASLIKEKLRAVLGLEEDVEKLESNLRAIRAELQYAEQKSSKAVLQDAEQNPSKTERLRHWLENLQNAAYDAEDVLETLVTEASLWNQEQKVRNIKPPLSASKFWLKYDAAKHVKEISARIKMINEEKKELELEKNDTTNTVGESSHNHATTSFDNPNGVIGRDSDKDKIIELLLSDKSDKDDKVSVISIFGLGGLGKTTLAQLIFKDERVQKHFNLRMWVCVRADFNVKNILVEIMKTYSTMKLAENLSYNHVVCKFVQFLSEKRYLLVLDDVWNEDYREWELLWGHLNKGGKGSKILVTSRLENVARKMATQRPYALEPLPENECWSLFRNIAFTDDNLLSDLRKKLEDIGWQIVGKCERLPLAVKAMGGLLRGDVDVNRWQRILESTIRELEMGDLNSMKPKILPALKLSYDYLPSCLKQCFVYCSIFPKGYAFDRDELVKLWMAQKFIQTQGEQKEETGHEYFNEFLVRSFFQVQNSDFANKDRYYMHDLIHDLAQFIASSSHHYCLVQDERSYSISKDTRHVSLLSKDIKQPAQNIVQKSKKLRTLVFPSGCLKDFGTTLERIFEGLQYLRVLDLSSSTIKKLPNSIEKLTLLCFLDLSRTEIKELPNSICSLYNLQTLKLLKCFSLIELPKDLIKLVNLRHLELDDIFWFKSSPLPPGIGNLTLLHNLHAFHVDNKSGYGIEELRGMPYLAGTLHVLKLENAVNSGDCKMFEKKNLQKLVLKWGSDRARARARAEQVLEGLQPHSNLKELQIWNYPGARFSAWMTDDGLLQNLVTVSLTHCTECKDLSFNRLPCLETLSVIGMWKLEKWQNGEFPCLLNLKISDCPKLSLLPESLLQLKNLKIKKCKSLKFLPNTPNLSFLVLVDNLGLEDLNRQASAPIREVKIINCPNLQDLPQTFSAVKLEISGCTSLISFPDPDFCKYVEHLALDKCHSETFIKAIFNISFLHTLFISSISNLASFPILPHLPHLKALHIRRCRELVSLFEEVEGLFVNLTSLKPLSTQGCPELLKLQNEGLPSALELLSVGLCPNLESLGTLTSLMSLKEFYIVDCPKIHRFPQDGLPTSLLHLRIQSCPVLTKRCQNNNGEGPEWPKIKHIPYLEIDSVEESSAQSYHPIVRSAGRMEPTEPTPLAQTISSRKRKRIDKKSGYNCIILYSRSLTISWDTTPEFWSWKWLNETIYENIEVANLIEVSWLDVSGKLKMSELSPGVMYEIVYVVKLKNAAFGWDHPLSFRLTLPGGEVQQNKVSLSEMPRGEWMELSLGNFTTQNNEENEEVCFDLVEHGGHWKSGLVIKGVILRPITHAYVTA